MPVSGIEPLDNPHNDKRMGVQDMTEQKERRPFYDRDHAVTICRDCDGSAPATDPWRTFTWSDES